MTLSIRQNGSKPQGIFLMLSIKGKIVRLT